MDRRLRNTKILIWDFDGTLYKHNAALWDAVGEAELKTIEKHTGWPRDKALTEFKKVYKKITPSATEAVAMITHIPTAQAAVENEQYFDRQPYLSTDEKLITMFKKLSGFTHFIFANGARDPIAAALDTLGVPRSTFAEIVTSEIVGVNKPHTDGFVYIMKKTSRPSGSHLMIGDREAVDLEPAKNVGMKTCLVWSEKKSSIADITLPTVYDVEKILLSS